ncbi:MAG TPA: ion channel [Dissulfurispiraceae bacterium]
MLINAAILGAALIVVVLWDAFETIVLPRRVTRRFRLTRLFYRYSWLFWSSAVRSMPATRRKQETCLSFFGPLSLLLLLGVWAAGVILGFALINWSLHSLLRAQGGVADFGDYLYSSATAFFTLGMGEAAALGAFAKALTIIEAGLGFGLLALVISYLPAISQSFSRREVNISLLDARAGSPSTAFEMLYRQSRCRGIEELVRVLYEWERWSAELLESHLSYPVLAYFRSQHENQSWLAALTTILDTSAFVAVGLEGACVDQARLTFAIARHAVVDLALVFSCPPRRGYYDRLKPSDFIYMRDELNAAGLRIRRDESAMQELTKLRLLYEPYIFSLADYLHLTIPPWCTETGGPDNWQTSAWDGTALQGQRRNRGRIEDRHF